jgi:murein L,D-transpeptidase YafK
VPTICNYSSLNLEAKDLNKECYFRLLICFSLLLLGLCGCSGQIKPEDTSAQLQVSTASTYHPPATPLSQEQREIEELLSQNGYNGNGPKPTVIVVHKQTRKLTLYQGLTPLKTYPVVLGNDPYNDKVCQGDARTPEGVYRVRAKYPHPRWCYFIWLDYPNTQNWLKFSKAKQTGHLRLDAEIGGQIGIHGTEDSYRNLCGENWTKGCVSLLNQDLEEIYPLVNDRTLVLIEKH